VTSFLLGGSTAGNSTAGYALLDTTAPYFAVPEALWDELNPEQYGFLCNWDDNDVLTTC